ncbi:helix-turn-helix transcriptional regulator [Colidextribacter sp. OB.20]|uniref:helix-turn-helix domain-containing protein n=1 Tax=Colidextribacter sp. OB.20 TaxID=2304568 RepID=UPI00136C61F0|nr:helix-turn-helix transcriptional regulator [Colidextribacter sp. OB.20]
MWTLYESILSLCAERGIKGGKMCVDLGLSKSLMTDLKSGRKKGITADTAQKIADYFNVSVDRVLGKEKAPIQEGERQPSDDEIKFALFGGGGEITDAMFDEVKNFAAYVKQREEEKKKKG